MIMLNVDFISKKRLLIISIVQFVTLLSSFIFGVLSYKSLNSDIYANWIIIFTVINSVFVLTSFGNDILVLKSLRKEEIQLSIFSDIFTFRLIGVGILMVPILIYLMFSLNSLGRYTLILFFIYLLQKLYIDTISSYYKLSGRVLKAIVLTLFFDLLIRIGVLVFYDSPSLETLLFSIIILNTSVLLVAPIIFIKNLRKKFIELGNYLYVNWTLYLNSFVVFLIFNYDIFIAYRYLNGDLLAGYLFTKSMFLAFKSLIDIVFETKIIEHSKSLHHYVQWVKVFLLIYVPSLLLIFLIGKLFYLDFIKFLPHQFLEKINSLIPYTLFLLFSLIVFPLFRHFYAIVVVFSKGKIVTFSNILSIFIIVILSTIIFFKVDLFNYFFPSLLLLYVVFHFVSYKFKYFQTDSP